jgi:hypothetical protein
MKPPAIPAIAPRKLLRRVFTLHLGAVFTIFALTIAAIGLSTRVTRAYDAASSFGGPLYFGSADLPVAANFIQAGGGPGSFSMIRAWDNMIGAYALQVDLTKLTSVYGRHATDQFVRIFDFAMADAWNRAGMDNVNMPGPKGSGGRWLALTILHAGRAPDGKLWMGYLFGHVLSTRIYWQVSADINNRYGVAADARFNRMTNQFLDYVAQQVEMTPVS